MTESRMLSVTTAEYFDYQPNGKAKPFRKAGGKAAELTAKPRDQPAIANNSQALLTFAESTWPSALSGVRTERPR